MTGKQDKGKSGGDTQQEREPSEFVIDVAGFDVDKVVVRFAPFAKAIWGAVRPALPGQDISQSQLSIHAKNQGTAPTTPAEAVRLGTKILDALLWFGAGKPQKVNWVYIDNGEEKTDPDTTERTMILVDQRKALLKLVIFCLLRGSYPSSTGVAVGADIPAFLSTTMGMKESPDELAKKVATFALADLSMDWIKLFPVHELPSTIRNRLALGMPGYRHASIFKYIQPDLKLTDETAMALNWMREFNRYPVDWSVFPPTRSSRMIEKLGSFNQLLGNLMVKVYSAPVLQTLLDAKMLSKMPVYKPSADCWESIVPVSELGLNDPIFDKTFTAPTMTLEPKYHASPSYITPGIKFAEGTQLYKGNYIENKAAHKQMLARRLRDATRDLESKRENGFDVTDEEEKLIEGLEQEVIDYDKWLAIHKE